MLVTKGVEFRARGPKQHVNRIGFIPARSLHAARYALMRPHNQSLFRMQMGAGARAAAAAYAAQLRANNAGGGGGGDGVGGQPPAGQIARYPPPQWVPRPAVR